MLKTYSWLLTTNSWLKKIKRCLAFQFDMKDIDEVAYMSGVKIHSDHSKWILNIS